MKRKNDDNENAVVEVRGLSVSYQKKIVLWNIGANIPAGKITGIIGPNGAGKSTFIKATLNLVPRVSGKIRIFGKQQTNAIKKISYMPQRKDIDWHYPISVFDLVMMGNYGSAGFLRPFSKQHKQKVADALQKVGMSAFAKRQISRLSGGQQQRAFLARALVQDSELYFMDEPFAGVDAATEKAIFTVLQELKHKGKTIVLVHHSLNSVKRYFDYVMMLNLMLVSFGPVENTFTNENLEQTYRGKLTLLERAADAALEQDVYH